MLTKTQLALICALPMVALFLGIILCIVLFRKRPHRLDIEKAPVVVHKGTPLQVSRAESNSAIPRPTQAVSQRVEKLNNILVTSANKSTRQHNSDIDPYGLSHAECSGTVPLQALQTAVQRIKKLDKILIIPTKKVKPPYGSGTNPYGHSQAESSSGNPRARTISRQVEKLKNVLTPSMNKSKPLPTEIISIIAQQGRWPAAKALRPVSKRCQYAADPVFRAQFHTLWLSLNNASISRFIGLANVDGKFQPRDLVRKINIATGVEIHEENPLRHNPLIVSAAIARFYNCTEIEFVDTLPPQSSLSLEASRRLDLLLRTVWKGIAESALHVHSIKHSARRGKSGPSKQPFPLSTFMSTPTVREGLRMTALTKLDLLVIHRKLGEDDYLAKAIGNMPCIHDLSLRVDKLTWHNRFEEPQSHLLKIKFVDSLFRDLTGKIHLPNLKTLHVETPIHNPVYLITFIGQWASILESLTLNLTTPRYDSLNELMEMFGSASAAYVAIRQLTLFAYYYHLIKKEVNFGMGWTSDEMVSEEKRLQFVDDVMEDLKVGVEKVWSKWFPEVDEDNWQGLIM
jgi:hypothetical protein